MTWQLIAHPEEDVCDAVGNSVEKALKQSKALASLDKVQNIRSALDSLAAHDEHELDLVVISSTMPVDEATSVGLTGRDPTKDFIKALKKRNAALPVIVVANTPDDRLADFLDAYDHTGIVTVGNDLAATMIERVKALRTDRSGDACVQLDIHLGGDQFGLWQLRRTGHGECQAHGMLQLDAELMNKLIRHSKKLNEAVAGDREDWLEDVDDLSSDLRQLLFRNGSRNIDCWDRFLTQREQVGGVAKSRICFTVNDDTHPMLVEALRDSGMAFGESWILNAPVFRCYAQQMNFPPLFIDAASRDGPINCLVIEADESYGSVAIGQAAEEEFPRLELLGEEAAAVNAFLEGVAGGVVHHLSLGTTDGNLPDAVLAKLGERQWHIVHFCGHVGGGATSPALVLKATPDGILSIKRLSHALNRTQLLFLNACRSGSTQVVMHAVENSVSAVLGFQWVIEDRAALEFATDFYRLLFDPANPNARHLEHALLDARKKAYRRRPGHPSWMAPVLVMQMVEPGRR